MVMPVRKNKLKLQVHKYAMPFPILGGKELKELADDIKANGQQSAIIMDKDSNMVDGRNRWLACEEAGVRPIIEYVDFKSASEIKKFIASANLYRRHLTTGQRAMIAAKWANMEVGDNKGAHRPREGGADLHTHKRVPVRVDLVDAAQEALGLAAMSLRESAVLLHVSRRSAASARKVMSRGTAELQQAVTNGSITVARAAQIADLNPSEQERTLSEMPRVKAPVRCISPSRPKTPINKRRDKSYRKLAEEIYDLLGPEDKRWCQLNRLVKFKDDIDPETIDRLSKSLRILSDRCISVIDALEGKDLDLAFLNERARRQRKSFGKNFLP